MNESKANYAAKMGVMLALSAALTTMESFLSAYLPLSVFGMRLGLSNVVIMTAAVMFNLKSALALTVLKALFVALTRTPTAGAMSVSGGILAFIILALLLKKSKSSYIFIGVCCSLAHMAGQLLTASVMLKSVFSLYYAPMLLSVSVLSGAATGVILNIVLKRVRWNNFYEDA